MDVEKFLRHAASFGSVLGLENMERLMEELGNVQNQLRVIHIAGTNGKGSVGAMLGRILELAGYRTGHYSSPAVFCDLEKYRINGNYINKEAFDSVMETVAEGCGRMEAKGMSHPTIFEVETAVAFLWFYQENCEFVILETGLGGRLDATNVVQKPLCSVITSISMDHMAFLGDTLTKIAAEKAGISKEGCPVITVTQEPEVQKALEDVCREKHSRLWVGDLGKIGHLCYREGALTFDWREYHDLKVSLLGAYQAANAVCALQTMECLREQGYPVSADVCRQGLETVRWPGRFEILSQSPLLVLDGAHNEGAAIELRKTLEIGFTKYKIIYIIGVLADKEHEKMLRIMLPLAQKVFTVTPDNPRALSGEILCQEARKYHDAVSYAPTVGQAFAAAREAAEELSSREGTAAEPVLILAFGSLTYLGALKEAALEVLW